MEEYQNIKKKLQRITFQIGLTKFKWSQKLKTLFFGHVTSDFKSE